MEELLKIEQETFESMRNDLIANHNGDWAVIYKDKAFGFSFSKEDALRAGYQTCGNNPFLCRRICDPYTEYIFGPSFEGPLPIVVSS